MLFSGGLDSLAGAVELLAAGKAVTLVSHRSATKLEPARRKLISELRKRFGKDKVHHVPVRTDLKKGLVDEPVGRTRSFLFAALAAVTARLFERDSITFFENGILSLNLPLLGQVVGARATRTTHPQALAGFRRVLGALLGRRFEVDNPFQWLTKAEVIERIAQNGCRDLIRYTRSCTRVRDMTILHPHCGRCSQCIDRRFAILAAGLEREDPEEAYKVDLLTGDWPPGRERELALAYVRTATEIRQIADLAFFEHFGEASRMVAWFSQPADTVAGYVLDLHRRHAEAVCRVVDNAIAAHASALREHTLPPTCLLSLAVSRHPDEQRDLEPSEPAEERPSSARELRLSIDEERKLVIIERWGELKGAIAEVLIALAEPFRAAVQAERAPEHYPFTSTGDLLARLEIDNHETLRQRIDRLRKEIAKLAKRAGDPVPSITALIESQPWRGYQLNPDSIRIVGRGELRTSEHVTTLGRNVTTRGREHGGSTT